MEKYIDLNRSFAPIPKDREFNEEEHELALSFGFSGLSEKQKWNQLLQLHRVIILAEAGAGKTWEIREATKHLRDEGKKAFFFRLEHLCFNFNTSFEIGTEAEFTQWLSLNEPAWFFLDSVDEARLGNPKNFEAAIRNFGARLGDSKQRAHIFITSRFSEWRAQSDLSLIKDQIPFIELVPTTEEHGEKKLKAEKASFSSSFSSSFSERVKASAVAPANPTITLSLYMRRIFVALCFIMVSPSVTWPSAAITHFPSFITARTVVALNLSELPLIIY